MLNSNQGPESLRQFGAMFRFIRLFLALEQHRCRGEERRPARETANLP